LTQNESDAKQFFPKFDAASRLDLNLGDLAGLDFQRRSGYQSAEPGLWSH
jgi:hypothetical protein